ncbi:MAG: DUF1549 and DUF1553 domain-containing protein [Opitutales bacterium]
MRFAFAILMTIGLQAASMEPDAPALGESLLLWLRADDLKLKNGEPVFVWPDAGGRGHDLTPTKGVRKNGSGTAPRFVAASEVGGRPAVRFGPENGLAGSPDHPLELKGDASLTIILVARYRPNEAKPPYDNLFFVGDPAGKGGVDPGRPTAALIEIDRSKPDWASLDFAGGWSHDATLGKGSAQPVYAGPVVLTFVKSPGPMTAVRVFFNGRSEEELLKRRATGASAPLDLRHREDVGVSMGRVTNWAGSFDGDVAEVIVYGKALPETERSALEKGIARRYDIRTSEDFVKATRRFTPEQKAHWAFQPVERPELPKVGTSAWVKTPVDRFVLSRLEKSSARPAVLATQTALLRRVTFDLTGLPPSPAEIDSFEKDFVRDPDAAYRKVVDRLLASPRYGERWGRLWMDVVRYGDTTASDGNFIMRQAWRYRDWIVDALNADLPYDRFLVHQLAGDLLPDKNPAVTLRRAVATGFLMIGPKALAESDKEQVKLDVVDEQLDVVGRAFLGLTIACARCHDHKFDPIPTVDYYSLAGIFRSTEIFGDLVRTATKWMERDLPSGDGKTKVRVMAPREGISMDLRVHERGSRHHLGDLAPRRFLQVIAGEGHAPLQTNGSGRLELARWIVDPKNPLTARVMVNRLWQGHFGQGIVESSDNFGIKGAVPADPALLDWLAAELVAGGWKLKRMHRMMVLSNAYRQSAVRDGSGNPDFAFHTPQLRRLEAEQFRDAILAVSGQLERRLGGNEIIEKAFKVGDVVDKKRGVVSASTINSRWEGYKSNRRSLYLPVIRNGQPDLLALFDAVDANQVVAGRGESIVPSQAAYLLNNPFVPEQAGHLASLVREAASDDVSRLGLLWRRALGRMPGVEETADALAFIEASGPDEAAAWRELCQAVFCFNEFIYLE